MKKTYTYNPEKIGEQGVDRMRFELGDTMVEGEQETSALCNEEYEAIIAARKMGTDTAPDHTHDCGPGTPESSGNGPADMRKPQVLCAGR